MPTSAYYNLHRSSYMILYPPPHCTFILVTFATLPSKYLMTWVKTDVFGVPGFKGVLFHHSEEGMVEFMVVGGCG